MFRHFLVEWQYPDSGGLTVNYNLAVSLFVCPVLAALAKKKEIVMHAPCVQATFVLLTNTPPNPHHDLHHDVECPWTQKFISRLSKICSGDLFGDLTLNTENFCDILSKFPPLHHTGVMLCHHVIRLENKAATPRPIMKISIITTLISDQKGKQLAFSKY